jgi:hypothetical protein
MLEILRVLLREVMVGEVLHRVVAVEAREDRL